MFKIPHTYLSVLSWEACYVCSSRASTALPIHTHARLSGAVTEPSPESTTSLLEGCRTVGVCVCAECVCVLDVGGIVSAVCACLQGCVSVCVSV